jgi:DNA helicase-2/ATP-dependent DNA helicase PcrA
VTKELLKDLNKEQVKAVEHEGGPLLIIAGAGTGKTTVITRRIAYLIISKKAKPEEILALTFTDKAAQEMEERVDVLVPYGYTEVWISTFHSFGDRVLRDEALALGLNPMFQVLSRPEQVIFFKEHLFEFPLRYYRPLGDPTKYIEAMISLISRARDEDVTPEEYFSYLGELKGNGEKEEIEREEEVALTYKMYQELKARYGKIDFGDQICLSLKLFRERPAILKKYQERFKYILIDEFQDTNYAQFQLVRLLAEKQRNIAVTGDDDQCLPPGTRITTLEGEKKIEDIRPKDKVITAVGKGYTSGSIVERVFRRKKKSRFLTFQTEKGYKLKTTANHKMFSFVPPVPARKDIYYVYLMQRGNLGWRLGVTSDLAGRLRLERSADRIIGIKGFKSEEEARYYETLWSLKYSIPTVCFKEREGVAIAGEWLDKLYTEINTNTNAGVLAKDLDVDLEAHHFCLDGVNRGSSLRVKINLEMCYRKYSTKVGRGNPLKNPLVTHHASLETSDEETIGKMVKAGIPLKKAKKGMRVRFENRDLQTVGVFAEKLREITGGFLENKCSIGTINIQHRPALLMPASNVLLGHYLPVLENGKIIYDKVVKISEEIGEEVVYDLEIGQTHNFIANGVVVHNSIYKFRGAAISNILNFTDVYPKAEQIVLTRNYRSPQIILDTAYELIKNNNPDRLEVRNSIDKRLLAETKEEGSPPKHLHYDTLSTESDEVAKLIEKKVASGKYSYKDFAILVRSNDDADPFLRAMNMKNIPYRFSGNQGLYTREEVRILVSFLRAIAKFHDSISLYHLASSQIYKLPVLDLMKMMDYAQRKKVSLQEVLLNFEKIPELKVTPHKQIKKLKEDFENYLKASTKLPTGQFLYKFLKESGYLNKIIESETPSAEEKIQNIRKFFNILTKFGKIAQLDRVPQFVEYLDMLVEAGDDPAVAEVDSDLDAVNVLTIHKAKGLEFPVVIMVSLVSQRFPVRGRKEPIELPLPLIEEKDILPSGDFHLQEERRLFYVGMTRAKKELYLTSARDYGGKRSRKVSPFLCEALGVSPDKESYKVSALEAIARNAPGEIAESRVTFLPEREILSLSYRRLDDYITCPRKYKYIHILRVPIMRYPPVIYGSAIHNAIQEYFRNKKNGRKVSLEDLFRVFESSWVSEGFLSREHEERRLRAGKETLERFFEAEEKIGRIPTKVEEPFNFPLGNMRIKGRWDLVEIEKGKVTVIDFKTSQVKDQKEATRKTKNSFQLSIYALAYREVKGEIPEKVELHFVESGLVGQARKSEEELEETIAGIEEAAKGIRSRHYEAKPAYFSCRWCPYQEICPYRFNR